MFCQVGQAQWRRSPGSFGQLMTAKGLFQRELIQRLGAAAQAGMASIGCRPFQSVETSAGSALSGRSLRGVVHSGTDSGRMRRLRNTITPPQAQRHSGRGCGGVAAEAAIGCRNNTCSRQPGARWALAWPSGLTRLSLPRWRRWT
jgi:hypothetical protein